jgi:G:T-mismatch repair DNA endonuclease (very short patch repair protein)
MTDLVAGGWDPLVVWECEALDANILNQRIASHLGAHEVHDVQA